MPNNYYVCRYPSVCPVCPLPFKSCDDKAADSISRLDRALISTPFHIFSLKTGKLAS